MFLGTVYFVATVSDAFSSLHQIKHPLHWHQLSLVWHRQDLSVPTYIRQRLARKYQKCRHSVAYRPTISRMRTFHAVAYEHLKEVSVGSFLAILLYGPSCCGTGFSLALLFLSAMGMSDMPVIRNGGDRNGTRPIQDGGGCGCSGGGNDRIGDCRRRL